MTVAAWLYFLWVAIALALSPGPAVLFVLGQGLRAGLGAATAATLGILAANTLYFALSGLGLSAVLLAAPGVFVVLKWGGVAYLVWIALKALRAPGARLAPTAGGPSGAGAVLRAGFLLQAGNPKALVFFSSILPPFVDASAGAWPVGAQIGLLGVTSVLSEFVVLLGYGYLAQAVSVKLQDPRTARWLDRVSGALLLGVAVWAAMAPGPAAVR